MDNSRAKEVATQLSVVGDRLKDLKAFDDTKAGVKGLVDAGITTLPSIFIRPPEELVEELKLGHSQVQVPVINLSSIQSDDKSKTRAIDETRRASEEWGFFQLINHGIPESVLDGMIDATRKFHEQNAELKQQYYSRDRLRKVSYYSSVDLYHSGAANWKDTLSIRLMDSNQVDPDELPKVGSGRSMIIYYINHVTKLLETLLELLSQSLGLKHDNLNALGSTKSSNFVLHYYPACPEPEKTLGIKRHTDPTFLTILLQNQIGGLQVLHDNQWTDVSPVPGSLIVNIGDLLQIISNGKLKSAEHRVLANSSIEPRISVACFFGGVSVPPKIYGPIKELISEESPKLYKEFTVPEYLKNFFSASIDRSGLDMWKIWPAISTAVMLQMNLFSISMMWFVIISYSITRRKLFCKKESSSFLLQICDLDVVRPQ